MKITDSMWESIKDKLPNKSTKAGRPAICSRKALEGMLYVLETGCQWHRLPETYGKYKTIHAKFMKWCRCRSFEKIMSKARRQYQQRNQHNNWYAFDTSSKKSPFTKCAGKNPTDRGKQGIKHALLVDRKGAPLFAHVGPANQHDSKFFSPVLKQLRPSKKIRIIAADSAFDVKKLYKSCKEKNIALIASINPRRRKTVHKFHAPYRWIVEQTFGILAWLRGLKNCWNKSLSTHLAFLQLACSIRIFKMIGIYG